MSEEILWKLSIVVITVSVTLIGVSLLFYALTSVPKREEEDDDDDYEL